MPDGSKMYETSRVGAPEDGVLIGRSAGEELKERAGAAFFEALYAAAAPKQSPNTPPVAVGA
jgi:hypothetical protein